MSTVMSDNKIKRSALGSNRQAHSNENKGHSADLKVLPIEPLGEGMLCYTCHSVIKRTKIVSTQDNEYRLHVNLNAV